ncbi:PTS sugar transporter subunit IIC [Staphylococcus pettenkoferi]|uniref:PTS sugar transporter subunit IIC n=1 Tax=Staphylococcus pettenkoferi TaxID=170573 RepID=A0A9Q4D9U9_9STAP|nr:PTS sugar transporter subunit IIC [Staphylococcus pettenkoferi]MCY1570041.1 PTS sugar transporter subunit IIC [Staphylococcus pettenkoferi]MCY1577309.1 PTS sugar transporter subunit IIC [Staphylococcus pettenkoferi]MCY1595920.1 PTS sugar transporter subunit IIC [Staphylococcus pettenkoferi]MCY1619037.1 PTS sugar transporter subunit IIC [Staphylococcus pettenkoferi]
MQMLLGGGTLLLLLVAMILFLKFAPYGKSGLEALSGAACATFLPQAFLSYVIGGIFNIEFMKQIGDNLGSLGGLAVGVLTCLKMKTNPVYAVIIGLVLYNFSLLPAFIAAYLISFGLKFIDKKVPEGLNLIVVILLAPAITYGIASLINPGITLMLEAISNAVNVVGDSNPYLLAAILGILMPITGMTPLSSMVVASFLGITGNPMAIGALTCMGASFVNFVLFKRLGIGNWGTSISVGIEPLTQIDKIVQYPLQLYSVNAIVGIINGCIITFSGLIINAEGVATPIAGPIVLFGFNGPVQSIITIVVVAVNSLVWSFIFSMIIKHFNLVNIDFKSLFKGKSKDTQGSQS